MKKRLNFIETKLTSLDNKFNNEIELTQPKNLFKFLEIVKEFDKEVKEF